MIDTHELMIGNWLYLKTADKYVKVSYHEIRYFIIHNSDNFYPIPITPEILRACGFLKVFYGWDNKLLELSDDYRPLINEGEYSIGNRLEYVHRLQNFHFIFTGVHLIIEL